MNTDTAARHPSKSPHVTPSDFSGGLLGDLCTSASKCSISPSAAANEFLHVGELHTPPLEYRLLASRFHASDPNPPETFRAESRLPRRARPSCMLPQFSSDEHFSHRSFLYAGAASSLHRSVDHRPCCQLLFVAILELQNQGLHHFANYCISGSTLLRSHAK